VFGTDKEVAEMANEVVDRVPRVNRLSRPGWRVASWTCAIALLLGTVWSAPSSMAQGGGKFTGTIRAAAPTWTGYGILYIADRKGFWKQQGLKVDFTIVEDVVQRFNAVTGGQLEVTTVSADSLAQAVAQGVPIVDVLPTDTSAGADGILAKKEIESVKALKGKTVAVQQGTASEWFLVAVLAKNGMSLGDVTIRNMTAGDAGAAFVAGHLDAAVTWEPWLSRAKQTTFGHVLASSADYPDVIIDTVAFSRTFAQKYPDTVKDFLRGYFAALRWFDENKEEAYKVIAEATKSKPDGVKGDLATIKIYSLADAKKLMGTSAKPGPIYGLVKQAADFWKTRGQLKGEVNLSTAIDPSFVNAL
jgi:NitT/TauT family transport system substrate-binding protein